MTTDDPLLNKQLGDYTIIDLLGQGGMARIYRGYDPKLDRYAAVKVIDSALAVSQDAEEYRERFLREARAIARLRHPNIVSIYQFGEAQGTYYMAMAFLEGRDLRHILGEYAERDERIPFNEGFRIIRDIASALDYAHDQGVIHRDIKPSNIMVTGAGAVLMDFGLALHVREGTTGNIFGTAHYIAPEQAVSSANAVPQSDMYSLGVVLYEMLAGHVPFDDPSAMSVALKHINDPPPPPRRFNPNLPPEVEAVLMRALEKEPQDRFPNGATLMRALEAAMGVKDVDETIKDPLPITRPVPPEVAKDVSSRAQPLAQLASNRLWIGGAVAVAVVLVAILLLSAGGQQANTDATQTSVAQAAITEEPTDTPTSPPTERSTTAAPGDTPTSEPTILATPSLAAVRSLTARSGPGSQYSALTTVDAGERLDIVGISEDGAWFQVALPDGALGWVSASPALVDVSSADLRDVPIVAPPTSVPTDVPTETPTVTPTRGVAPTATSASAEIILYYDPDTLVLLNRSDGAVDVSRLTFVQVTASGRELTFSADRWEGGSRPTDALPPGSCFQAWTSDFTTLPRPDYCASRAAQAQVSAASWFWISDDPAATFQVVRRRTGRADEVLATCLISAGECPVSLGRGVVVASAPTSTSTPAADSSDTPSPRPTDPPAATSVPSSNAPVLLTYDEDSLTLFNRSNRLVDVSALTFIQVTASGRQLSFLSDRWEGGSRPPSELPPGDCFQVWRDSLTSILPKPDDCDNRHSWQAVGSQRWFWVSDDPDATFEVRRGGEVLAVCLISTGQCPLNPDRGESSAQIASAPARAPTDLASGVANVAMPPANAPVVLFYDADMLALINNSAEAVDVSGMLFVQVTAAGRELSFSSDRWEGGGAPPAALPPGDCFQVWRDAFRDLPIPDGCDSRQSWQIVSSARWFWVNDNPDATFEARRGDAVLAVCRIGDGVCEIEL